MTHNYDLAVAEYTKALREHPNNREAQLASSARSCAPRIRTW